MKLLYTREQIQEFPPCGWSVERLRAVARTLEITGNDRKVKILRNIADQKENFERTGYPELKEF